jgi:CubicO group peptidase (beta-lactamase class C family)
MILLSLVLSLSVTAPFDSVPVPEVAGDARPAYADYRAEPRHSLVAPEAAGLRTSDLLRAAESVEREIRRGGFPGAALAIGRRDQVVVERGLGHLDWLSGSEIVDPDLSVYDLASLTKVVATTTAVMLLVEDGKLALDTPVRTLLPGFSGGGKDFVTIRHLLTHTSGLPAGAEIRGRFPEQALASVIATRLEHAPGTSVEYSDIGFIVLASAAAEAAGEPLYRLLDRRVFGPLGMRSTTFLPGEWCGRCAPTDQRRDGSFHRGIVHDPLAQQLGGIAGHAGLFSTVHDLARFAAMLSRGGELDGIRVLKAETLWMFTQRQQGAGTRALGWDTPDPRGGGAAGLKISPGSFGHTGFTGTSLWVDPVKGTWTVLLSNRTFEPRGPNRMQALRRQVNDLVASAVEE